MNGIKKILRKTFHKAYKKLKFYKRIFQMKEFQKKHPKCILFYSLYLNEKREYFSQHNQDYIIYNNFFKNKKDGIFCDVGANHPLNLNNTRYFEEFGWRGCVFEPLPYLKPLWDKYRHANFFPYAASDKEGEVTFSMVKGLTGWEDMLSFIKDTSNVSYDHKIEDILVKTRPLKNVFKEESIKHIDYMSIDVEGHELNVLRGIDFSKVKIDVLTIENNFGGVGNKTHYGDDEIRKIMFENDYILWGRIVGLDDIYVHKNFKGK